MYTLDHILWATPDLEEGSKHMHDLVGINPEVGGRHPGFGTRNSLLSLGDEVYLEIIAPDLSQDLRDNRGGRLETLTSPKLLTFAVRTHNMSEVELLVKEAGLKSKGAKAMSRKHPDGQLLKWQVLRIEDHAYDDFLPFFIDWGETPHPALTTQKGCELIEFQVTHPDAHLVEIYEALRLDIQIENSDSPALKAILKSPKGEVTLIS